MEYSIKLPELSRKSSKLKNLPSMERKASGSQIADGSKETSVEPKDSARNKLLKSILTVKTLAKVNHLFQMAGASHRRSKTEGMSKITKENSGDKSEQLEDQKLEIPLLYFPAEKKFFQPTRNEAGDMATASFLKHSEIRRTGEYIKVEEGLDTAKALYGSITDRLIYNSKQRQNHLKNIASESSVSFNRVLAIRNRWNDNKVQKMKILKRYHLIDEETRCRPRRTIRR